VINLNTTLEQQLLNIAVRQAVTQVPTHRDCNPGVSAGEDAVIA
jgi:hypothetical protein